ncbi:MAG: hypothetical protein DMG31_05850 [Acidobacteria bacterium]|nr:MAG: hypothetical protein DMG31_05850 [Acidobacteriota bacterium]
MRSFSITKIQMRWNCESIYRCFDYRVIGRRPRAELPGMCAEFHPQRATSFNARVTRAGEAHGGDPGFPRMKTSGEARSGD